MKIKHSVAILVFNDKGELALQLRAAHDDNYPSHWDFSAAGGIEPEERHEDAASRELKEEIGIKADLTFLQKIEYEGIDEVDTIYLYKTSYNGLFKPDKNEVAAITFFSIPEIQKMIHTGEKFHPEFLYLWENWII